MLVTEQSKYCASQHRSKKTNQTRLDISFGVLGLTMFALASSGCQNDVVGSETQSNSDGATHHEPTGGDAPPLFAVTSRVISQDWSTSTSYLWLTGALNSGSLDASQAIELPGGGTIWGVPGSGVFYVVSTEELTLTKVDARSGSLQLGEKIGLSAVGASLHSGESMVFADANRAYLFDLSSSQAIELDLAAMTIVRSIDLGNALIPAAELNYINDGGFRQLGHRFVASVYGMTSTWDRMYEVSKIIYFDPTTAAVEVAPAPCGPLAYSIKSSSGDLYFAGDTFNASLNIVDPGSAPEPCLALVPADGQPPSVLLASLNDLTGFPTGGLIPGSDGKAYLRALDPTLAVITDQTSQNDLYSMRAWHTWSIDLQNPGPSAVKMTRAPMLGGIKVFEAAGQAYENESSEEFGTTTLVRTTGAGAPAPGLQMPGTIWGIVQVR